VNIPMLVISILIFAISLKPTYEVWFLPAKFVQRVDRQRRSTRQFLGFSYWRNGKVNLTIARSASAFVLALSLLGTIFSITGPIVINVR
jgi:hypothetical protein